MDKSNGILNYNNFGDFVRPIFCSNPNASGYSIFIDDRSYREMDEHNKSPRTINKFLGISKLTTIDN